jgi:hypothetical protein
MLTAYPAAGRRNRPTSSWSGAAVAAGFANVVSSDILDPFGT